MRQPVFITANDGLAFRSATIDLIPAYGRHIFPNLDCSLAHDEVLFFNHDFAFSPFFYKVEYQNLIDNKYHLPIVYVAAECPLITPWDIAIENAMFMTGNCDGVAEAKYRHSFDYADFQLMIGDIAHRPLLCTKINAILGEYLGMRMHDLGLQSLPPENLRTVYHQYELQCRAILENCIMISSDEMTSMIEQIKEGSSNVKL